MTLEDLGYNQAFENLRTELKLQDFEIGRVIAQHKERYVVKNLEGEYDAEITGNLRYSAKNREDFPAVGDWVALIKYDTHAAFIHSVLPRQAILARQAVEKFGERQIIATNVDFAFLLQAVDRDFNINRLERYLAICYASKVNPIIVLTKTDLIDDHKPGEMIENIKLRFKNIPVVAISNETGNGIDSIRKLMERSKTYCLLGSSGVGKSTLMNNLSGRQMMKTDLISTSTNKGRHTTSHRELTVLKQGGILIDNPGMREIGIADVSEGMEATFDEIINFAKHCKFADCTHTSEVGCAVIEAVESGEINRKSYENYLKIEKENEHFDLTVSEKRKKEKAFGKMVKNFKNDMQKLSSKHNHHFKK